MSTTRVKYPYIGELNVDEEIAKELTEVVNQCVQLSDHEVVYFVKTLNGYMNERFFAKDPEPEADKVACSCPTRDLLMNGCKCGGV